MRIRKSSKVLSSEQIHRYKQLAIQLDRDEREQIIAIGRAVKAQHNELRRVFRQLQTERERLGLSLAEIARRTGIDRARLSRLENAERPNVTLQTLERYALALNKRLTISMVDLDAA